MAKIDKAKATAPNAANDNCLGLVDTCRIEAHLPGLNLNSGHLARRPTEEELRIRRVTAALRGRLAELAAARRALDECREPDG